MTTAVNFKKNEANNNNKKLCWLDDLRLRLLAINKLKQQWGGLPLAGLWPNSALCAASRWPPSGSRAASASPGSGIRKQRPIDYKNGHMRSACAGRGRWSRPPQFCCSPWRCWTRSRRPGPWRPAIGIQLLAWVMSHHTALYMSTEVTNLHFPLLSESHLLFIFSSSFPDPVYPNLTKKAIIEFFLFYSI